MNLVYIENQALLGTVLEYLKNSKIPYTTDLEEFDTVIFAEITPRMQKKIASFKEQNKRIIFLLYLEEEKLFIQSKLNNKSSRAYKKKIESFVSISDVVVTSLPFFKTLFEKKEKFVVIEEELPVLNLSKTLSDIYKKYDLKKRKKRILILDFHYHYLDYVESIALKYPKKEILYVGLKPMCVMTENEKRLKKELNDKASFFMYYNFSILTDLIQVSDMIICFDDIELKRRYLYAILLLKKELLIKQSSLYEEYLINSKNVYTFKTKDGLIKKLSKIEYDRLSNLTDNAYDLIRKNTNIETRKKFLELLQ